MNKTKAQIARHKYGCSLSSLTPGEKATVTRLYNAQEQAYEAPVAAPVGRTVKATIGRVGYNGSKLCMLTAGSTVKDLLNQSGYTLDTKKEGIMAESTGRAVSLTTELKNNETYVITAEIKSA